MAVFPLTWCAHSPALVEIVSTVGLVYETTPVPPVVNVLQVDIKRLAHQVINGAHVLPV